MKRRVFLAALLCMPLMISAAEDTGSRYLAGAVPTENGIVTFRKSFTVNGKSQEQIFGTMSKFVQDEIVGKAIQDMRSRIISDGSSDGTIVARAEEYIVFKKKPLYLDRTRLRYQLSVNVSGNKVNMTLTQVSYYYNEDIDGTNGINYKAEEWITDEEALNKKQTKLLPRSGKFRVKTIDRVEEIFNAAMDAFDKQEAATRKSIISE
ncbi:MAG: DUF4468 domain-containing protein [Bacteroidaceae bacterium]|nr:DUF4468 domain-containing protein [Bacteroidaceae bacterium]